ncbi:beta-galactosidase-1-like protein 2 [Oppia nitens]|uniref:beta-galactosidase-1-like protein 2 n=1 Tax=Oppia nitens TaxID=1686743 RepID=UPI0023DC4080|nr:beta-galactosidase-1-like protein 2 [Oppia nitens]
MNLYNVITLIVIVFVVTSNGLQTNYEYYTSGGIKSGLRADSVDFTLNDKKITLFSGSLHYFRLPQQYWKDRLLKFRAAGLNAVETYVPWNLHEQIPGQFDFETGFLNLKEFLETAKQNDLFVVFRIGPYICAEWEMGGFPAWMIRDPNIKLRSNYKPYLEAVGRLYTKVLSIINDFQFTKGGPIIALQFENEFHGIHNDNDRQYFQFLRTTIESSGFKELLFNCDPADSAARAMKTALPGILETVNFNSDSLKFLNLLREAQPNKPLFVTEFWSGMFDRWGVPRAPMPIKHFEKEITDIMFVANSSLNFYMFFGGTNFGFMNGANGASVTTSYDYNGPLSESGNYTEMYWKTKELITKFTKERGYPQLTIPDPPKPQLTTSYGKVIIKDYLSLDNLLSKVKSITTSKPQHMELLNLGENYGQSYGFINYRLTGLQKFKHLKLNGGVSDRGIILIDHKQVGLVVSNKDYDQDLKDSDFANTTTHTLDIIVENTGRTDGGQEMNWARKGLNGDINIDGKVISDIQTYPLEFKEQFVNQINDLRGNPFVDNLKSPAFYRSELIINGSPKDTFIRLDHWVKGNVFINGFNLGRYYEIGPQKTLYIPSPLLKSGKNTISMFELHSATNSIEFIDKHEWK